MNNPNVDLADYDLGVLIHLCQKPLNLRRNRDIGAVKLFKESSSPDVENIRLDRLYLLQSIMDEALVRFN